MSDDLLKRLSYFAFKLEGKGQLESAASDAMAEAATRLSANRVAIEGLRAEVERLRADNERLRETLQYMVNVCPAIDPDGELAHELARNMLEGKP